MNTSCILIENGRPRIRNELIEFVSEQSRQRSLLFEIFQLRAIFDQLLDGVLEAEVAIFDFAVGTQLGLRELSVLHGEAIIVDEPSEEPQQVVNRELIHLILLRVARAIVRVDEQLIDERFVLLLGLINEHVLDLLLANDLFRLVEYLVVKEGVGSFEFVRASLLTIGQNDLALESVQHLVRDGAVPRLDNVLEHLFCNRANLLVFFEQVHIIQTLDDRFHEVVGRLRRHILTNDVGRSLLMSCRICDHLLGSLRLEFAVAMLVLDNFLGNAVLRAGNHERLLHLLNSFEN